MEMHLDCTVMHRRNECVEMCYAGGLFWVSGPMVVKP